MFPKRKLKTENHRHNNSRETQGNAYRKVYFDLNARGGAQVFLLMVKGIPTGVILNQYFSAFLPLLVCHPFTTSHTTK